MSFPPMVRLIHKCTVTEWQTLLLGMQQDMEASPPCRLSWFWCCLSQPAGAKAMPRVAVQKLGRSHQVDAFTQRSTTLA